MADVTRQVLIEFTTDTTGLQPTVDQLAEIGTIEKSTAAAFKATNTEASKQAKILQDVAKSEQAIATGAQPLKKSLADISTQVKQMGPAFQKEFQKGASDALKAAGVSAEQLEASLKDVDKTSKSLKAQLREMTQELARMKVAGQDNTEQYKTLAKEAGHLKDAIGDANQEIKNFGSDTQHLDGAIGLAQGLAGGFAAVQGAAALFGDESEELQKTLLRVNAAMAILQGLQQIQITLQKESAAAQFANTLATKAQAAAQLAFNVVIGTSTGLLRVFRLALAATGVGLLIVGIIELVKWLKEMDTSLEDANTTIETQNGLIEAQNEGLEANLNLQKARLEAAEVTGSEIIKLEGRMLLAQRANLAASIQVLKAQRDLLDPTSEAWFKLNAAIEDNAQALGKIDQQLIIKDIQLTKQLADEREEAAKKGADLEKQRLQNAIYRIQAELVGVREGSRQELELKKLLFQAQSKLEIFDAKGNADQILLIRQKLNNDILEMEKAFRIKAGEGVIQAEAAISALVLRSAAQLQEDFLKALEEGRSTAEIRIIDNRLKTEQKYQDDLFKLVESGGNKQILAMQAQSKKEQEQAKKDFEDRKKRQSENAQLAIDFAMEAVRTLDIIFRNQADKENQRLSEAKENVAELRAAGAITEKEAQQRLKRIEIEEKRVRKEQAEREKKLAVFNALIAIPQAFLKGFTQGGPILGAIYAAIAGAQAALVLSRPVPKFGKGKKDNYQGLGEVGETGTELIEKDGRMYVADRPQVIWLNKQDKVFNPTETTKMLQGSRMSTDRPSTLNIPKPEPINYELFGKEVAKNIPAMGLNIDEKGFTQWMRQRQSFITYLNARRGFK